MGNLAIGCTVPLKTVEIYRNLATSTVGSGEVLRIRGDDGNTLGRVTELGFGTGSPTGGTGSGTYSPVVIGAVVTNQLGFNTKDLYFATRSICTDSAPVEVMRITGLGSVGIGTTTPFGRLHVTNGASGAAGATPTGDELVLENSTDAGISILSGASSTGNIYFGRSTNTVVGGIRRSFG